MIQWRSDIPLEDFEFAEEKRAELGLSRAEFFHLMLHQTNWSVAELYADNKKKDERIKELEKENSELKRLVERLEERIRKLEVELEKAKGDRPARTYEEGKLLRTLAEHAREGISWADLCAEVLDLRDEKKMKRLMSLAFEVKTTKKNTYATRFYPKRTAPEFKGWVLVRPEKSDGPVLLIDYELYREDTLKAAKSIEKGEAIPEVKPLKTGKAAERWLATFFEVVERQYMSLLDQKRGKDAKEFLEEKVPEKLEKVLQDIDPDDWRRAVLAVLDELEVRAEGDGRREVFVSNLRRVVLRALKEAESHAPVLEVKADV